MAVGENAQGAPAEDRPAEEDLPEVRRALARLASALAELKQALSETQEIVGALQTRLESEQESHWFDAIFGTWPGDETDEELLRLLDEVRGKRRLGHE